jgi:tRNA nucleotidyltransferase (CCA-adding enzyme)
VIKANSDKSKHLETAVIKVYGEFIDLVNLRSEEYSEDSRVPKIEIGTPEQDAYRRDLTFNSLFYNINTKEIEDYTGKGINDLKNEIVRTPLPPKKTFIDDPLRVLRTIRFAQRFGFNIT